MAEYNYFEEFSASLIVTRIDDEIKTLNEDEKRKALKMFVTCGGGFCFNATKDIISGMITTVKKSGEDIRPMSVLRPGPMVVMFEDFFEQHTDDEIRAIMLHEMGHAAHGDCNIDAAANVGDNFYVDVNVEIRADNFAVARTSKKVLMAAIKKCLLAQAIIIAKLSNYKVNYRQLYSDLLEDDVIKQRLANLA